MRMLVSALLLLTPALGAMASAGGIRVDGLRCDFREDTLAIEDSQPRLSWLVASEQRDIEQSAYSVMAATTRQRLDAEEPDLWDSGKIASADMHTRYGGKPLQSAQTVYWRVCVWDGGGRPSPWSDTASWTMGLLEPADWQAEWIAGRAPRPVLEGAQWIWAPDEDFMNAAPGTRFFCRMFELESEAKILSAKLEICADNVCNVRIGNEEVAKKRSWERAESIDVTDSVHPGSNIIGLEVTNTAENPNPAGVIARLDLAYADGTTQTLVTDKSWLVTPNGIGAPPFGRLEWRELQRLTADWPHARELGPCGMEPWGEITRVGSDIMPIFRKEFAVEQKAVKRAMAFICGLGHFELSINGATVGDHVIDPGWTDYKDTCLYVPFDVTEMLKAGPNALGVMLGNGMYNVPGGRYTKFLGSFGEPKLILHLRVDYEDGTVQRVVSDDSWKTDDGPIVFSCVYGGEDYDTRREQPGWDSPGFDDSAWDAARVVEGPGGKLRAQSAPPIRVAKIIHADSIGRIGPGQCLVDLGENLSARPFMTVRGPAGARVTITTGELIDKPWEGHSYTYTLKGQGEETFRSRFTYFGFRYLHVSGVDLPEDPDAGKERAVLLDVGADFITSSAPAVGAFHCANPLPDMTHLFNDIDTMINRSVRSNLQSVLTDCPHREKLGWLEVAHLMGPSILYRYDAHGLYRKICRDTTDSQLDNGLVPDIAPEYTRFDGGFFESAEWGSASVQLPWLLYRWYGDEEVLDRQYNTMARYTRYLATTRNEQGLAKAGLGDWYDWTPEHGHRGASQLTPGELTATAMLYDNACIVAEAASLQGKEADVSEFSALAKQVRDDFIAAYYNPAAQTVATGSQSSLAVALHFGLCPDEARETLLGRLVAELETNGYRQTTGEVCFRYLLLALADAGRSDVIYQMLDRTDAPGYGHMLRQWGLKTLSERWDKPGSSLNHCMFGHAQEWFTGYLLGIRQAPGSVGFEHLHIEPTIVDGLNGAEGYFDSPRGRIEVSWKRESGNIVLDVTVPGNTTADIVLPSGSAGAILESGGPLAGAPGVRDIQPGEQTTVTAGSGLYRFTWPAAG